MNVNGIFNPQNRFWSFIENMMNLCVLGLLWLLCSLPLITAGASTAAMFHYTLELTKNEEGYVGKTFIRGFRSLFVRATLLWMIMAGAALFLVFDLYCCQFIIFSAVLRQAARILILSLMILSVATGLYLFPFRAFFRTTVQQTLIRSFITAVANLHITAVVLLIYGLGAAASYLVPPLFMIWFAFASYAASFCFAAVFRRYEEGVQ